MKIQIAQRLSPYTHLPGTVLPLPGSHFCLQLFPTLLRLFDMQRSTPSLLCEVHFSFRKVIKPLTIQQDLERGFVKVFGEGEQGYFRYWISSDSSSKGIILKKEKGLKQWVDSVEQMSNFSVFHEVDRLSIIEAKEPSFSPYNVPACARLSLGIHKAQLLERIYQRKEFKEIFPLWHRLGQLIKVPKESLSKEGGALDILKSCREAITQRQKVELLPLFTELFTVGFAFGLTPRLEDSGFHGFVLSAPEKQSSALQLLKEGASLIESLFVQFHEDQIEILPVLPPKFASGRLLRTSLGSWGDLDLEWSKKSLRRLIFHAKKNGSVHFIWPKELKRFRLRTAPKQRGEIVVTTQPIKVEVDQYYLFDRFQK